MNLSSLSPLSLNMTISTTGQIVASYEYVANTNFNLITTKINSMIGYINSIISDPKLIVASDAFEYQPSLSNTNGDISYNGTVYMAGIAYSLPAGYYLKSSMIPFIPIENIVDGDEYVKMRIEERDQLLALRENGSNGFSIIVNNNSPITTGVQITTGKTLSIKQLSPIDPADPQIVKIDSEISLDYYHKNKYNITPYKPDPSNPYRYKLYSGPYVKDSLRVFVNSHRVINEKIDQTFNAIGEFRFISTIPLSELPNSDNDKITCDYDIPFIPGADAENSILDIQSTEFYADKFTMTGPYSAENISAECIIFPDIDNVFEEGDWVGITDSTHPDGGGLIKLMNPATGDLVYNYLGVIIEKYYEDGINKIKIANGKGLLKDFGTWNLSTNAGKEFFISATAGEITTTVPTTPGDYKISVGICMNLNGEYYLYLNPKDPVLIP